MTRGSGRGNIIIDNVLVADPTPYAVLLDDAADPIFYVGEAVTGSLQADAVWRIKKINTTTGVVITWANGTTSFDNAWTARTTLTYS